MATQLSKSALVAPILMATPNPCSISSDSMPMMWRPTTCRCVCVCVVCVCVWCVCAWCMWCVYAWCVCGVFVCLYWCAGASIVCVFVGLLQTFSSGRTVISFLRQRVLRVVTSWYIGMYVERYIFRFPSPYLVTASATWRAATHLLLEEVGQNNVDQVSRLWS